MTADEPADLPPVPESRIALRIATQVAAAGALIGAVEGLIVASRSGLFLEWGERIQLSLGAVVADATVAFSAGLVGGAVGQFALRRRAQWRRYQRGFSVGFSLVAAFFLVPMAVEIWRRGDPKNTVGVFGVWCSVSFFGHLASGYAYRREMIGLTHRLGWRITAFLLAGLLAMLSGIVPQQQRRPEIAAPAGATNVILITIDTLRRDHLGVYGASFETPHLDRLGLEGAIFDGAITPLPETAPSHASMLTGRHPAETQVIQNGRALPPDGLTVAEQLGAAGWRNAAFVSSFALDSSVGLDQGFEVYDDEFSPVLRGLGEVRTGNLGLRLLMRFGDPADWPSMLERRGDSTVARALRWLDAVPATQPVFLWVHLFDPHSPYDAHGAGSAVDHRAILAAEPGYRYTAAEVAALRDQYAAEVRFADAQVGVLVEGLRSHGRLEEAAILVVGDHGESLGEHGIHFTHHGIYDEVLRVPMLLWASHPLGWEPGVRVGEQVSVQDVANTLVDASGVPRLTGTDSTPLRFRLDGTQVPVRAVSLMGRAEQAWLYGVRGTGGVKYILAEGGAEEVYDASVDPAEANNLVGRPEAASAVRNGRSNVEQLKALVGPRSPGGASTAQMLQALGYTDPPAPGSAP